MSKCFADSDCCMLPVPTLQATVTITVPPSLFAANSGLVPTTLLEATLRVPIRRTAVDFHHPVLLGTTDQPQQPTRKQRADKAGVVDARLLDLLPRCPEIMRHRNDFKVLPTVDNLMTDQCRDVMQGLQVRGVGWGRCGGQGVRRWGPAGVLTARAGSLAYILIPPAWGYIRIGLQDGE